MRNLTPLSEPFKAFKGGLVVTCTTEPDEVACGSEFVAMVAAACEAGGAVGIRANGPQDISTIKQNVNIPVIGYYKVNIPGSSVSITPTLGHAEMIAAAGADAIELDASQTPRPGGMMVEELIRKVKQVTGKPVIALVASVVEGILAANCGADALVVSVSSSGAFNSNSEGNEYNLLTTLSKRLQIPLIANGNFLTPEAARKALDMGALTVIAGSAITKPQYITEIFVRRLKKKNTASLVAAR